jgi:hypothetical protein
MQKVWKVTNKTKLGNKVIERWIDATNLRNYFELRVDSLPIEAAVYVWPGWGLWPFPSEPYSIIISDMNDPVYTKPPGCGVRGGTLDTRCSVAYCGTESDKEMGARVWHELLHAAGADSDQLNAADKKVFLYDLPAGLSIRDFLEKMVWAVGVCSEPYYTNVLLQYYTFLTKRLMTTDRL